MKDTGQWVFLGIVGVVAVFSAAVPILMGAIFSIIATYIGLKVALTFIARLNPSINLPVVSFNPLGPKELNIYQLSPDITEAVQQIGRSIAVNGDTLETLNTRFGKLINAPIEYHKDLFLISKRLMFEYRRRYGDLDVRFIRTKRLTVQDVTAPLTKEEQTQFLEFLRSIEKPLA